MKASLIDFHLYIYKNNVSNVWGNSYAICKYRQSWYYRYLSYLKTKSQLLQEKYEKEFFAEVYYGH